MIGPRGRTQKELEHRTGAKILFRGRGAQKDGVPSGHPDDDDELHVSVEGPADCVQRAVDELEDIMFNPEKAEKLKAEQLRNLHDSERQLSMYGPGLEGKSTDDGAVELQVPNHLVGYVIGKGGENIQKMQAQTGGHIQIAKESDMKPGETLRRVTLRGTPAAVDEIKTRIENLIADRLNERGRRDGAKTRDHSDYSYILKVAVPNEKVGVIIGKGGIVIKAIQDRTGSHVQIPPQADDDNPSVRTLSIGAESREAVEACQMEIFMVLQQQQQQTAAAPMNVMYISIPDDKVGVVIGKGGATIKDLQNRHGCRIQIPQVPDAGSDPPVRTMRYGFILMSFYSEILLRDNNIITLAFLDLLTSSCSLN